MMTSFAFALLWTTLVDTGPTLLNTEGLPSGARGHTHGAVGMRQFVQAANGWIAVYGKDDALMQVPPVPADTIFGPACAANRGGPVSVQHVGFEPGHAQARWRLVRMAGASACLAVSAGEDARGPWRSQPLQPAHAAALLASPRPLIQVQGPPLQWQELRNGAGAMQVVQQGRYAPDALVRRHALIGRDKAGNIALAYQTIDANGARGVRYTGRMRQGAPGRMDAEQVVVAGSGVPLDDPEGGSGALSIDPVDRCTFWLVQPYVATTGRATWQTRIATFRFRTCR